MLRMLRIEVAESRKCCSTWTLPNSVTITSQNARTGSKNFVIPHRPKRSQHLVA
jgi:hypothetical protein